MKTVDEFTLLAVVVVGLTLTIVLAFPLLFP